MDEKTRTELSEKAWQLASELEAWTLAAKTRLNVLQDSWRHECQRLTDGEMPSRTWMMERRRQAMQLRSTLTMLQRVVKQLEEV